MIAAAASNHTHVDDDRLPPHSRDAERHVLGAAMHDNSILDDLQQLVRPDDFYGDAHQQLYRAMLDMRDRGRLIDLVTLGQEIIRRGQLQDVGGAAYLGEIYEATATAAAIGAHADIIRTLSLQRALIRLLREAVGRAEQKGTDPVEDLEWLQREMLRLALDGAQDSTKDILQILRETRDKIDGVMSGEMRGIPTGFAHVDEMTGGLHNGELIIVAARTSVGKTGFAVNMLRHAIMVERVPVFIVSLEQSIADLGERLVVLESLVSSHALRTGAISNDAISKLVNAFGRYHDCKLYADATPSQTLARIAANCRRHKRQRGVGLVFIDYLQLIEPENRRAPRHEQVGQLSRGLQQLSRELKIPVVVMAQLNRELESRADHTPRLSDLRESGEIEMNSDCVFLLHRPELFAAPADRQHGDVRGLVELNVAKQRHGPTGIVDLTFDHEFMRFRDRDIQWSNHKETK